jgi:hypothetical protein
MSWTLHAPVLLESLYTLAKEKLNMNTFTKTLIASAMAVAVAGTASAGPKFIGAYQGDKTTLKITPAGCPNAKANKQTTFIGFAPGSYGFIGEFEEFNINIPFSGCWSMTGVGGILEPDVFDFLRGIYIEKKVDKDLTMALTFRSLFGFVEEDPFLGLLDGGIVGAMNAHLISESKCDVSLLTAITPWRGVDPTSVIVKKGQTKISKNGEQVKVDIRVDAKYNDDNGKNKNIKAKIKGKMDYNAALGLVNEGFLSSCDSIVEIEPLPAAQ